MLQTKLYKLYQIEFDSVTAYLFIVFFLLFYGLTVPGEGLAAFQLATSLP
jgi:hypothetical protein